MSNTPPPSDPPSGATPPVLEEIVAHKRVEVERAKSTTPLERLKEVVAEAPRPRNFFAAVVDEHDRITTRVIAEVKRKSPSAGVIREDFDPVRIARQYEEAGASAISCLTDEKYFGGHLGYIQQIRQAVSLPVLRKDFIVDAYQVWEARAAGADAVLLIAEVLTVGELLDMMILCKDLGLTSLVEVHDMDNLLRLQEYIGFPHAGYGLLGINNRNLRTMTTDLNHTLRVAEVIDDKRILVSESGIRDGEDLVKLRRAGINIVLIGEQLMRQDDPGEALRSLLHDSRVLRSD